MNLVSIGWVVWDVQARKPKRNILSGGKWYARKTPTKVYQSEKRAQQYCKEGQVALEVFTKQEEPNDTNP